jgi:hypothetical protein
MLRHGCGYITPLSLVVKTGKTSNCAQKLKKRRIEKL